MCGMTSAPIKTSRSGGGREGGREDPRRPTVARLSRGVVAMGCRRCSLVSAGRQGDQMRAVRHLFPSGTKSQRGLEKRWPGMRGGGCQRGERGGELSALIALSGSKQGTCRALMYRGCKGCELWSEASRPPCYVQAGPHFQTLTPSKNI